MIPEYFVPVKWLFRELVLPFRALSIYICSCAEQASIDIVLPRYLRFLQYVSPTLPIR